MTGRDGSHELRPEFRAHLEWQIQSALRRETRFAEPVPTRGPRLRTAAMLVLAMVVGGIAVGASAELPDARERQAVLEGAQSELKLIQLRVELARADLEQARQRFEVVRGRQVQDALHDPQVEQLLGGERAELVHHPRQGELDRG